MTGRCRRLVEGKLRHQRSSERITDWLGRSYGISISKDCIYQHIGADRAKGRHPHAIAPELSIQMHTGQQDVQRLYS